MRKYFAVFALLLVLLCASGLLVSSHDLNENDNITIIMTDKGFFPDSIKINLGTTVIWVNKDNKPHWPASDLHPTHTRYPGSGIEKCGTSEEIHILDACNGIKKNGSFSFHFDEAGNWTLHDHLNPRLSMSIEVVDNIAKNGRFIIDRLFGFLSKLSHMINQKSTTKLREENHLVLNDSEIGQTALNSFNSCHSDQGPGSTDRLRCYSKEFRDMAFRQGSDYAFSVLYSLQKIDDAAKVCHVIAHGIGWGTYEKNTGDWQNQIAKINPTCVYGALHGILEAHLDSIGSGKLTKEIMLELCQTNPKPTCFHAIGHLALVEVKDNLSDAIELCYAFSKEKNRRHYCLTGIFMEHMIAENLVQHGMYPLERRIYWYRHFKDFESICRYQKGENNTACWTEMVHPSSINFRGDPMEVIEYCNNAETEAGRKFCRRHAFVELFPKSNFSVNALKWVCAVPQPNDQAFERDCYISLIKNKLLVFSPEESGDLIDFCSSLGDEFKGMCFSRIGETFRERYFDNARILNLCIRAPLEYQKICAGNSSVNETESPYLSNAKEYSDLQKV